MDKQKKKRGRPAPPYGPRICTLCGRKLRAGMVGGKLEVFPCKCRDPQLG